jgi:hypothetical protein
MQLLSNHGLKELTDYIKKVSPTAFVDEGKTAKIVLDNISAASFGTVKEYVFGY